MLLYVQCAKEGAENYSSLAISLKAFSSVSRGFVALISKIALSPPSIVLCFLFHGLTGGVWAEIKKL